MIGFVLTCFSSTLLSLLPTLSLYSSRQFTQAAKLRKPSPVPPSSTPWLLGYFATHTYSTATVSTILHLIPYYYYPTALLPYYYSTQVGLLLNQLPAAFLWNPSPVQLHPAIPYLILPYPNLPYTSPTPPQPNPNLGLRTVLYLREIFDISLMTKPQSVQHQSSQNCNNIFCSHCVQYIFIKGKTFGGDWLTLLKPTLRNQSFPDSTQLHSTIG